MTKNYLQHAALACTVALAFGTLTQGAQAQSSGAAQNAVRKECSADFRAHCRGVRPGGRDAQACLEQNIEHLSQKCQDALFAIMPPPTREVDVPNSPPAGDRAAAAPPERDHPPAVISERDRAAAAPPPRYEEAPPPQRATEAPMPRPSAAEQSALRKHCRTDFIANCQGVPPNSPDALACLQANLPRLSSSCQRSVNATLPHEQTPIVSAPPPDAIPGRHAVRNAEAAADEPPPPPRGDYAPTPRDDYAAPPPQRDAYAPPPRAERALPPPPRAERAPPPPPADERALRAYCGRDFAAHCPSLRPGSGEAVACLQRHASSLMPRCRRALSQASAQPLRSRSRTATVAPMEPPPPPEHRRVRERAPRASDVARACRSDLYRHCSRVRPGSGRELACLAAHQHSLTPRCRTTLRMTYR